MQEQYEARLKWADFSKKMIDKPARGVVRKFAKYYFDNEATNMEGLKVIDVGRQVGNEAKYYAAIGCQVTAIHWNTFTSDDVLQTISSHKNIKLNVCHDLSKVSFDKYDIFSSTFCLPFMPKNSFSHMWNKHIVPTIKPGGYFVGHFFGDQDGWAYQYSSTMTFMTKEEVQKLFDPLLSQFEGYACENNNKIGFKETKKKANLANGGAKDWHIFSIIAKKKTTLNDPSLQQEENAGEEDKTRFCALI